MSRCFPLLLIVLLLGACVPSEGADNVLEQSRPAIEMAADHQDLDPPVEYGFARPVLASAPEDAAGFPRWYCPKSVVSRAQIASFIARTVNGIDAPLPAYDGRFSDVTSNNMHAGAITFVAAKGISDGCAEGAYCPDAGVTRGQMALFAVRIMYGSSYSLPTPTGRYADVPADHLHAAAVEQLALDGIDVGCGGLNFCPDRPISRDEVAAFLVAAKYQGASPGIAPRQFADVALQNPNLAAVNILARDGVTFGCDAPNVGYRLQGEPLTDRQRDWILYIAGRTLPRLTQGYNDAARAFTVGARVIWWSLKEGVFGMFDDPFRHSLCNGEFIGAFDSCNGEWEVGVTAAMVPGDAVVRAAANSLYPGRDVGEVALDLLEFGRQLSSTFDAGEYPEYATTRVATDANLQRSWLARDATIGAWLMIGDIERNCIESSGPGCFGTDTEASRDFAPDVQKATLVQGDIRRILVALRPR